MRKQVHNMYEDGSLVQSIKKGGWKKQAKKVIASVMAAAMVITGSAVVSPQGGAVVEAAGTDINVGNDDLILAWNDLASFYSEELPAGDFTKEYSFHNTSKGEMFWHNFAVALSTTLDSDEYVGTNIWYLRADRWSNDVFGVANDAAIESGALEYVGGPNFETFAGIIKDSNVNVSVKREGTSITIEQTVANVDGESFTWSAIYKGASTDALKLYLGGENCKLSPFKAIHKVTVNYVVPEGASVEAPASKEINVFEGSDYSIESPALVGYRPLETEVTGTMGAEDVTVEVAYESAIVHNVTVKFVTPEGVTAPEDIVTEVSEGAKYSIEVPEVEGCKPDKKVVTGTMGEEDIEVTVTYSKSLNYTISGQWNALGAGYQVKVKKNFDIDFNFHNAGGNNNWENYGVALDMNATVGTWASGWFLRADRWSNLTITEPTYALVDCSWGSWDDGDSWWTTFRDVMKDANVVVNVKRVSDIITITNNITGANGETLIWTAVANNCPTERMAITLCCESPAKATIDSVTDNSAEGNGFLTEDDLKNDTSSSNNNNNTFVPVITPSPAPTASPSAEPSESPSVEPTVAPSTEPTTEPTVAPTTEPTVAPTVEPTTEPTDEPSNEPSVNKGDKVTSSKVTYTVTNVKSKTVSYQKDKKVSTKKTVSVPATVKVNGETYKVTTVAKNAFANAKKLTSVTVGKNITKIGDTAFKGCGKLTTITIKSTKLTSVGKNVLKGTSKKLVIKVPASKVAAYKKLFKGKGNNSVVIKKA